MVTFSSAVAEEASCGCVPSLSSLTDRIEALQKELEAGEEPLVALTHLLRLCRDEHPRLREVLAGTTARHHTAELKALLRSVLPPPGAEGGLTRNVRHTLADALRTGDEAAAVVAARTLAVALDSHYGHTFVDSFRSRTPYQPAVGDPVPLDSPDLRRFTAMPPTAPPWRLAQRLDETRWVRLAGAWTSQFKVVLDYSLFDQLGGLLHDGAVVATCHPNTALTEFGLANATREPTFPVQPLDLGAQEGRIATVLRQAEQAGASVAVLPELCVTENLAAGLEDWVRRPGPLRLLVAGSFHHVDHVAGRPVRVNRAIAWARGHPTPLLHDKHSPADRPVLEDIAESGWPELRVYVISGGLHLVMAVCRDLLNPSAVHALTEIGANLILVPAMSETLVPFGGPAAQLVGCGQAFVAVANNPADWTDDQVSPRHRPARALFGHPGFGQQTRLVPAPDAEPGVALLQVRTGQVSWHGSQGSSGAEQSAHPNEEPDWVQQLASRVGRPESPVAHAVRLRLAAVLVLLKDGGAAGPEVLLTARADDLANYPDQVVFPGGLLEPADGGPEQAALREAAEEVGLDPTSVHVIGTLASFALPESRFLVVPVLAWTPRPRFTTSPNLAEVTRVGFVPLRGVTAVRGTQLEPDGCCGLPEDFGAAQLGEMTATVLTLVSALLTALPTARGRGTAEPTT